MPENIRKSVSFPIYYPDPRKLPTGFTLDTNSFKNPVANGVTYNVSYDGGQQVVFSVQPKPNDSELQNFTSSYIPLNNQLRTAIGTAKIGAYYNHNTLQTLVSLPTNSNAWLIITAPNKINQSDLKQVLEAIRT